MDIIEKSLQEICYEQICDHYWNVKYGDFKLVVDRNTGYFNATDLCEQGGKVFKYWMRRKDVQELMDHYKNEYLDSNRSCFQVIKEESNPYPPIIYGTYAPSWFLLNIALWVSKDFYLKASQILNVHYMTEFNERFRDDKDNLEKELERMQSNIASVSKSNERYRKLTEVKCNRPLSHKKRHIFTLIRKNTKSLKHPLHVIRAQKMNRESRLKKLEMKFPDMEILMELSYNPRIVNFYKMIRENIDNIRMHYNDLKLLNGYTEGQLIKDIKRLADEIKDMDSNTLSKPEQQIEKEEPEKGPGQEVESVQIDVDSPTNPADNDTKELDPAENGQTELDPADNGQTELDSADNGQPDSDSLNK